MTYGRGDMDLPHITGSHNFDDVKIINHLNIIIMINPDITTAVADTIPVAIELPPPARVPLTDYFMAGGPILMSVITILLIAILFAAWKAPAWVKDLGRFSFAVTLFLTAMGFFQIFDTIAMYGEVSFRVLCSGFKVALIPFFYGLIVYAVSILITIAQKPRL